MNKVSAKTARYIKLGEKGRWEDLGLSDGTLRLQFFDVPHELGRQRDIPAITQLYVNQGRDPGTARKFANQVADFYDSDPEVLWLTFAHGYLWWAFAEPEVHYLGNNPSLYAETGSRYRHTKGPWCKTALTGEELTLESLPGPLRATAGTRNAICDIHPDMLEALLRRINGEVDPLMAKAQATREAALETMRDLMKRLNHEDFEVFVDLTFSRLGWQRIGALGKTQKTVDMQLLLPATGERSFVQVKSRTTPAELASYVEDFQRRGEQRMYYAYHTSSRPLSTTEPGVTLLDVDALAEMAWRGGLFDWLLHRHI
ncbi:MAG: hypothetical protein DI585_07310 [Pseudomonas fluorescens]|nr:MAG: hypothetical protein DI585_07310 [Pseudomonas fluorescens]